jgi:hypothetical protein
MMLAARAWQLRENARAAIAAGDLALAADWARQAQAMQWTRTGAMIERTTLLLMAGV